MNEFETSLADHNELSKHEQLMRLLSNVAGLVLDVGANFGYYSLYAATLGCRVLAFEPVGIYIGLTRWASSAHNACLCVG